MENDERLQELEISESKPPHMPKRGMPDLTLLQPLFDSLALNRSLTYLAIGLDFFILCSISWQRSVGGNETKQNTLACAQLLGTMG